MKSIKNEPLVSVVITNYNYRKYIDRAIESVLNQSYENIELIIVDDGSTDGSNEIISKYEKEYSNIRYYRHNNKGAVFTRNKALKLVRGEYFVFVDSDDYVPENFVSELVKTAKRGNYDVVYCDLTLKGNQSGKLEIFGQSINSLIYLEPVPICQLVKSKWAKTNKFDKNLNNLRNEDNDFFFGLWADGAKFGKAKNTTYYYYVHNKGRNTSSKADFYKPWFYIMCKYASRFPEIIDSMVKLFNEQEEKISWQHSKLQNCEQRVIDITNSRSYRIGRLITKPIRILRKGLNEK